MYIERQWQACQDW